MKNKAVITGDIVRSEFIGLDKRGELLKALQQVCEELQKFSPMKMEIYRGDSFQIVMERPEVSLKVATLIRSYLISKTPQGEKNIWDARISIGIGEIDYVSTSIVVSDGEAFRLSGRGLDNLDKARMCISTKWDMVNEEVAASIGFVDYTITKLSVKQAQLLYMTDALELSQLEIAARIGKSQQNISKTLITSLEPLLSLYWEHFEKLINRYNEE